MTDTKTLIASLSNDARTQHSYSPSYWGVRLIAVLMLYAIATQMVLGIRPDIALQFTRPFYALEILLLAALVITSSVAAVLSMYPDSYQKPKLLTLPYAIFLLLAGLIVSQYFMPLDMRMVMPEPGAHTMECAICIACVALVPSAIIFALLRRGASVRPFQAGTLAVLAASSIGCLTLRLAEAIDSIPHLVIWHYLPTLLFAVIGALLGKFILKW